MPPKYNSIYDTNIDSVYQSRDILRTLDGISDSEGKTVCMIPFGSTHEIFKVFPNKRIPLHLITEIKSKRNLALYTLKAFYRSGNDVKFKRDFLLYKIPEFTYAYVLISIGNPDLLHQELRSLLKHYYHEVILSFIKSHDLIRLLEKYRIENDLDEIMITRASQKIRYFDKRKITSITWPKSSLEEASIWLENNDGFFTSLQFKAMQLDREVTNSFIDRQGTVRIERNFSKVFQSLVKPNLKSLDHYVELFMNRGRRENKLLEARPLEINFEQEVFKEKTNHSNFIEMISLLEDASVSVLHGNPYIHLNVMDYIDGSSYDLWVVDSKQILLVPQLNSTIASLKRVVNHIYDYYAEGEIKNHEYRR
jgi:hypothetical protein